MEAHLALDTTVVRLQFEPGDDRIGLVYRLGRILSHVASDGHVSIEAEVPRRVLLTPAVSGAPGGAWRMRATRSLLIVLMLALAAACAPKTAPPPATPGLPRYPEFVFPKATPGMSGAVLLQHENAWRFLQAGDLRGAERGFTQLTKRSPDLYPAHAGLGYAALARKDHKAALEHFNHALTVENRSTPRLSSAAVRRIWR